MTNVGFAGVFRQPTEGLKVKTMVVDNDDCGLVGFSYMQEDPDATCINPHHCFGCFSDTLSYIQCSWIMRFAHAKPWYDLDIGATQKRSAVPKEICPNGFKQMIEEVWHWRCENNLPLENLAFVDLGSGIGQVPLMARVIAPEFSQAKLISK